MRSIIHLTGPLLILVRFELVILHYLVESLILAISGLLGEQYLLSTDILLLLGPQSLFFSFKLLSALIIAPNSLLFLKNLGFLGLVHSFPVIGQHSMGTQSALTCLSVLSIEVIVEAMSNMVLRGHIFLKTVKSVLLQLFLILSSLIRLIHLLHVSSPLVMLLIEIIKLIRNLQALSIIHPLLPAILGRYHLLFLDLLV